MNKADRNAPEADLGPANGLAPSGWERADTLSVLVVVLLVSAFFLPTIGSRPLAASHEAKAGLLARQMFANHEWFVGHTSVSSTNKPMLYYWLAAGFSMVAGEVNEWTVRLPSLLSCIGVVLLAWALARDIFDRPTALVSALILATTMQFHRIAQTARLDSMVALSVMAGIFCLWKALTASGRTWNLAGWLWASAGYVALATGCAAKGPIAIVLTGLAIGAVLIVRWLSGEGRLTTDIIRLHPVSGGLLVLLLAGPVFLGMERADPGFLKYFFLRENLARAGLYLVESKPMRTSHPFHYYFATIWIHTAPWSLFIPPAIVHVLRRVRTGMRTAGLLPLLSFAGMFLFLSCVSLKKWQYLVPLFAPLAVLVGALWADLMRNPRPDSRFIRWTIHGLGVVTAFLGSALVVILLFITLTPSGPARLQKLVGPEMYSAMGTSFITGLLPLLLIAGCMVAHGVTMIKRRMRAAFVLLLTATVLGMLYHDAVVEPVLLKERSVRSFAHEASTWLDGHPDLPLYVCAGEPYELVFYLDRPIRYVRPGKAITFSDGIRPVTSSDDEGAVHILLARKHFWTLRKRGVRIPELLTTPTETRGRFAVVLTTGKLVGPARSASSPPSRDGE